MQPTHRRPPVRVRRGTPPDAAAVWPLVQALAISYVPRAEAFAGLWADLLSSPSACVLVATEDGQVVGLAVAHSHIALNANGPVVWLEELVVDTAFRRRGVGASLVESVERWGQSIGAGHVALATRRAMPFYVALGYTETAAYARKHLDDTPA